MRIANRHVTGVAAARTLVWVLAAALIAYLAAIAAWPGLRVQLPERLSWFGAPNSAVTIGIVVAVFILLGATMTSRAGGRRAEAPVTIIAGLAVVSALLGFASYWRCQDESHPDFFTPLLWTAALVKGGDPVKSLAGGACPSPTPVALNVAQISALAALFASVIGIALAVFRSRFDRIRMVSARSVTVVVGVDNDAESLVAAIAGTIRGRSTLLVVTDNDHADATLAARRAGACVVAVDLHRVEPLVALPIWHKTDRLYLLAADPSTNLLRLRAITAHGGGDRQRIPLVVRIDDPWQAAAWRAQHFGGVHNRWAADTVGIYEVTARRLLERVLTGPRIDRLLVCGSSQLTTALCGDMLTRRIESEYSGDGGIPTLHVIADDASVYRQDYEFTAGQLGHADRHHDIAVVDRAVSVGGLSDLIADGEPATTALILVDSCLDGSAATRIAARFPETTIHVFDPLADVTQERISVVGRLYTYRLSLDLPSGQAHDAWERAAALIHNRYVVESGASGPAAAPWAELGDFYRESNRRQVLTALWMVERFGGHTWNAWGQPADGVSTTVLRGLQPREQLQLMGFDESTAEAMAGAEPEDGCRYYRANGWRYGPHRDDDAKVHDKLVGWPQIASDPRLLTAALRSLAATLMKLRELGYRSHPSTDSNWTRFHRAGAVVAEQRSTAWTWTAGDGATMHAAAGDWEVHDEAGEATWSVRDDIFRATHQHVGGKRWRRLGSVLARRAKTGETVDTLEGASTAPEGSWVVQGDHGDVWAVPGDEFDRRYRPADQDRSNADGK